MALGRYDFVKVFYQSSRLLETSHEGDYSFHNETSMQVLSTRMPIEAIDPSEVPPWVFVTTSRQYFQMATVTVLIYEASKILLGALASIAQRVPIAEITSLIELQKRRPRSPVDFVYFANRYSGIFGAIAFLFWNTSEANLPFLEDWVTFVSIDYILILRVLALHSQEKWLSIVLKGSLALQAVGKMAILIYGIKAAVVSLAEDATSCDVGNPPSQWGVVAWVIPMIYGVILMALALYKATEYWRISAGFKGFTLVKVLIQDQIIYFILVIASCALNITNFNLQSSNVFISNVVNELGNPAYLSILGSRMLFNLKEAGERVVNMGTSFRVVSETLSDMDFAQPGNRQRCLFFYITLEIRILIVLHEKGNQDGRHRKLG
ncbi:hypothetical protein A7U60_g5675 [Sanghuangporus baumii]|uniref:Uncharacterized protein n=1 Tax=Sanghuangporus baumii TaxID=108892 RepID=A0A9Q5HW87_SANBA|nr:hypothetical protein A7U60_g5675 [Sanghuangporus baumii]